MATTQQYSLKWNNYISHLAYHFENLRSEEEFTDVTLCCEGKKIKAHKIILSACSTYFREVFKENPHPHPVVIFKNVKYNDLQSIIQFMYNGEVSVIQDLLPSFLQTAELLQVRGLTDTNLTESAKNLVAEETRPTETLFFAVPQETNKILTALSTAPMKAAPVQQQEIHTIRLDTSKLMEAQEQRVVTAPTLVKRKKITTTQQQQPQQQVSTVQTYETLGLDQEGELMEAEEGVEFLQTGMKMEMADFIDVPTSKTATVTSEPGNYIQQDITYQIIDSRVVPKTVTTTQQAQQTQDTTGQESDQMETAENESGDLSGIFTQSDTGDIKAGGVDITDAFKVITYNVDHSKAASEAAVTEEIVMHSTRGGATTRSLGVTKQNEPQTTTSGSGNVCEVCMKTFTSASALRRHTMSKHSALNMKFQCSICGMSYKTKWSLSTHISRYHRPASEKMVRKKVKRPTEQQDEAEPELAEFVVVKSE